MKPRLRKYEPGDIMKVRNFIIRTHSLLGQPNSWGIDRWEFVPFCQEKKNGTLEQWLSRIGIWERENGEIAAVACDDGDAYFLLDTWEPGDALMHEMFEYAESHLLFSEPGRRITRNALAITAGMKGMKHIAASRGYVREPQADIMLSMELDRHYDVILAPGFVIKDGNEVNDQKKALGHIRAFDYEGTDEAVDTMIHFGNIRNAPDYRAELDLFVMNPSGEVVSFCGLWHDEINHIAILEPVGTHKDYRRKGLGKAVIYEGLNRLRSLGVREVYVGSDQPFYRSIGMQKEHLLHRWVRHF